MSQITLSDGANTLTVWDCPEERPTERVVYDVRPDSEGVTRVYQKPAGILLLHLAGRLLTKADAERLEGWLRDLTLLSYAGRDGVTDGGWRIHGDPPPRIVRKDGDSDDWMIDFKLWRLP
jgi:hypothetical protein